MKYQLQLYRKAFFDGNVTIQTTLDSLKESRPAIQIVRDGLYAGHLTFTLEEWEWIKKIAPLIDPSDFLE